MSSDDEEFVFYGTPIEREEEITTRKKKAVAEASGQLRTALPPWKQEVTDEEGRRRFHGAFTGGYSAGYFNSVGSKEGWTPQTFTSSRKNRAEVKQQDIYNFLDEDEKSELEERSLGTSMQFDTFGFTAAEFARKQVEKEQQERPSTIPGPVPDELIMPASESIGVKLLSKMGWRQGRSIEDSNKNSQYDARREARKAFLALSSDQLAGEQLDGEDAKDVPGLPIDNDERFIKSTPVYVLNPKQDVYGLGYDPFKQAPEFRENKRQRISGNKGMEHNRSLSLKGKIGAGFGIGALEDLDEEDVDVYASGYDLQDTYVQEIEEPSQATADTLRILDKKTHDILHGFKAATSSDSQSVRFDPPVVPRDFVPLHKFPSPLGNDVKNCEIPPPEVHPPEDNNLKVLIEGVATLVARCGKLFEDLSKEKNQSNPLFSFLNGGDGSNFYARKLWEERQKLRQQNKLMDVKMPQNSEKLTAERRGSILGEKSLERSSKDPSSLGASASSVNVQFQLSDTFTQPVSANEHSHIRKPFLIDPAKQERFEQFLKDKYEGGLRTKDSGGSSKLSESARARERLEFETAAEAIRKGNSVKESDATNQFLAELSGLQFVAGGVEKADVQKDTELIMKALYPKREEFQWRPAALLCKRFDLVDPYMGKPPPPPRARSKIDSLIFMPDSVKSKEENVSTESSSSLLPQKDKRKQSKGIIEKEDAEIEVEVENVERPVDLYKAIFSDDSEDEEESSKPKQGEDTQKKIEVVNTTLNRLIAGDFLESLGKELGLVVPPDSHQSQNKVGTSDALNDTADLDKGNSPFLKSSSITNVIGTSINGNKPDDLKRTQEGNKEMGSVNVLGERSTSLEHQRNRKHSSHRHKKRYSSSESDTTSNDSDDYRDKYSSRSKRKDKESSLEKSSSKRRSKHHKHRRRDSPNRSHRSSGKDYEDRKRKKHKYER